VPLQDRVEAAKRIIGGLCLGPDWPSVVALIGHGATAANNPQLAGLHCGACGGQTGELNARVAAHLLNDPEVRAALAAEGRPIPTKTVFVAGMHNTTTDDVTLFDKTSLPASHRAAWERFTGQLKQASEKARAERAARFGFAASDIERRARDWSETRPEWGLVRNMAFVIAPRSRTEGLSLEGRSFLHEYRWQNDADGTQLEAIMTAPMIVTHWINMQYFASTVDPVVHGSGNKTLHNVVADGVGVFEGGGGDLRTGLAWQSVHDGTDWVHEPLRLNVVIEARREAIDAVIEKHALVRQLVENQWIAILCLDPDLSHIVVRRKDAWDALAVSSRNEGLPMNSEGHDEHP
jgi:uncharacterized protein YbcC (UPF0753/DUF2309 family)